MSAFAPLVGAKRTSISVVDSGVHALGRVLINAQIAASLTWRGQARIIVEVEAKDLPASAATGRCFHSYRASSVSRSGLRSCDHRPGFTLRGTPSFFGQLAKCEVAHTSLLIGRSTLPFVDDRKCSRSTFLRNCPAHAGPFCAARIILLRLPGRGLGHNARLGMARHALRGLSPSNAKGPVSDNGAFRTFLRGRECSLTPPISQFVTLSFGSKGRPSSHCERAVGHRRAPPTGANCGTNYVRAS